VRGEDVATGVTRDGRYLRNENQKARAGEAQERGGGRLTLKQLVHLKDSKIQVKVDNAPAGSRVCFRH